MGTEGPGGPRIKKPPSLRGNIKQEGEFFSGETKEKIESEETDGEK